MPKLPFPPHFNTPLRTQGRGGKGRGGKDGKAGRARARVKAISLRPYQGASGSALCTREVRKKPSACVSRLRKGAMTQLANIFMSVQCPRPRVVLVGESTRPSAKRPLLMRGAAVTQAGELRWCLALPPCKATLAPCQEWFFPPLLRRHRLRLCFCSSKVSLWLKALWMQVAWISTRAWHCLRRFCKPECFRFTKLYLLLG